MSNIGILQCRDTVSSILIFWVEAREFPQVCHFLMSELWASIVVGHFKVHRVSPAIELKCFLFGNHQEIDSQKELWKNKVNLNVNCWNGSGNVLVITWSLVNCCNEMRLNNLSYCHICSYLKTQLHPQFCIPFWLQNYWLQMTSLSLLPGSALTKLTCYTWRDQCLGLIASAWSYSWWVPENILSIPVNWEQVKGTSVHPFLSKIPFPQK